MLHTGQLLTLTTVLVAPSPAAISSRISGQRQVVQPGAVPLGGHGHAVAAQRGQALQLRRRELVALVPGGGVRGDLGLHVAAHGVLHGEVVFTQQHGVHRQDHHVEQVAAQQVADGHVQCTQAQRGQGDCHFRQRGHQRHQHRAGKAARDAQRARQRVGRLGQPAAGSQHHQRGQRKAAPFVAQLLRRGAVAHRRSGVRGCGHGLALMCMHTLQRQQVHRQQQRAVHAHVRDRRCALAGDQAQRHKTQHHDAEPGRQQVRGTGFTVHRLAALQRVDDHQEQQVDDTGPQHVAHRQVGRVDNGHRTDARGQLGQRGHRGQQRQPDPATAPAVGVGQGIGTAAQCVAGACDQQGADDKLGQRPGAAHGCAGTLTRPAAGRRG
jgi:hypothetical protein